MPRAYLHARNAPPLAPKLLPCVAARTERTPAGADGAWGLSGAFLKVCKNRSSAFNVLAFLFINAACLVVPVLHLLWRTTITKKCYSQKINRNYLL